MKKLKYYEMEKLFREHNEANGITTKGTDSKPLTGVIVFDPTLSKWKAEFQNCSIEARSYRVSSDNKRYLPNIGTSIFADCLDGQDNGVRLDLYMWGNDENWVVDYCYLEGEDE